MITISPTSLHPAAIQQTKGGLTIGFAKVWSQNKGFSMAGRQIGTLIGERIVITINTNQLTAAEVQAIELAFAYGSNGQFYVKFVNPKSGAEETKLFFCEEQVSYNYSVQKLGKFNGTTITMQSVEVV